MPGGPGVVEHHYGSDAMRDVNDRGHVLHFHGDRARAFAPDQPRVLAEQRFNSLRQSLADKN